MADNYLEKKMEEYRQGKLAASTRRKTTPSGTARGCASFLPFPVGLRVLVLTDDAREEEIKALVDAGCRVAFTGTDKAHGTAVARTCGAQHHPVSPMDSDAVNETLRYIQRHWIGLPDVIITHGFPFPVPGGDSFKISIGPKVDNCNINLQVGSSIKQLLWALLPQTKEFFLNKP